MPRAKTAGDLVSEVRDHLQIFSPNTLRDGFPDDPLDDDGVLPPVTQILRWINNAYTDVLETGIIKCIAQMTVDGSQDTWEMSPGINEIVRVTLDGVPLTRVTLLGKDARLPGWSSTLTTAHTGRPTEYYTLADLIGFFPRPDRSYTFDILADVLPDDLVLRADVPTRIPSRYHSMLSVGGALYINGMVELENPMSDKRVGSLSAIWKADFAAVKRLVNDRGDDAQDSVSVMDYRSRNR